MLIALALMVQDPAALIEQLGSPDPAAREHATQALINLEDDAIAALQAAREGAQDPEVGARIDYILEAIERGRPVRNILRTAPPVDLAPAPYVDISDALSRHFGIRVEGLPEGAFEGTVPQATLMAACDALARSAGMTYEVESDHIRFMDGDFVDRPAAYNGPFRFWVASLSANRTTDFDGTAMTLTVRVNGIHHSRVTDLGLGAVKLDSLTLDTGQTLEPQSSADPAWAGGVAWGGQVVINGNVMQIGGDAQGMDVVFEGAPAEARRIVRLNGHAEIIAATETAEWVFDRVGPNINAASGPAPATAQMNLEMNDVGTIVVTIQSNEMAQRLSDPLTSATIQQQTRIVLVNAEGEAIESTPIQGYWQVTGAAVMYVAYWQGGTTGTAGMRLTVPLHIETVEVPFEIVDVPIP